MADIEEIFDLDGGVRRLGALAPDPGMLAAFAAMTDAVEEYTDAEIERLLLDPNRVPSRKVFTDEWICNQLSFGSCNGWAGAEVEARGRWRRGIRDGIVQFSGSYLYSWMNGGRDQGSALSDSLKVLEERGVPPVNLCPADHIYRKQIAASVDVEAAKHRGFRLRPVKTMQGLRTALAKQWPCVVAIHAGGNFQRLNGDGVSGVDNGQGNHSVCADDLVRKGSKEYFDMPNSWGLRFGEKGRSYLTEQHFRQTFGVHTFWALPTTHEG